MPEEAAAQIVDAAPLADIVIEGDQHKTRLFACLEQLDERHGLAIRSAFLDGLSYAQLADRMAVPLGTMKSWIRRGLQQLKMCMGDG